MSRRRPVNADRRIKVFATYLGSAAVVPRRCRNGCNCTAGDRSSEGIGWAAPGEWRSGGLAPKNNASDCQAISYSPEPSSPPPSGNVAKWPKWQPRRESTRRREAKDRSSKWLIEHHAGSFLFFGGITGYTACRAAQSVITVPQRLPDGLLDVFFPGETEPHPVIVEISTYPDSGNPDKALDDVLLVLLARRIVPDVLTLVLHPKGQLRVEGQTQRSSRLGLTQLGLKWKVIDLWTIPAVDLLAANDVELIRRSKGPKRFASRCPDGRPSAFGPWRKCARSSAERRCDSNRRADHDGGDLRSAG